MRAAAILGTVVCVFTIACDKRGEAPRERAAETAPAKVAAPNAPSEAPRYVGSAACTSCHERETKSWQGSHHDLAMQEPDETSVLGDFARRTFKVDSETFTFRKEEDAYWVDVRAGKKKSSFKVRYVFGVEPLQQLLLDVGKGHLQALSVAWDSRPREQGGQRWFSLQPGDKIPPGDPLHWQGPQFTWNNMCADCHSTNVQKGYARNSHSYDTRFSEIDVACESCHGPSSLHVSAAKAGMAQREVAGFRGLVQRNRRWVFNAGAPIAHLEGPRADAEQESCAPCHARRADLGPGGENHFHDRYRLSLLEERLYFPDGQVEDEVFEYGSFLQSRMHAAGVTCSDCHDSHSSATRERGNAVCTKCHRAEVFDAPTHHLHAAASTGAACVACHMPERTYMVIDARREHRFSVPRPDLSACLHSPDPCTACHRDKDTSWATKTLKERNRLRQTPHFGDALSLARAREPGAAAALALVCSDPGVPAIARATALSELVHLPGPDLIIAIERALGDASPLLRRAAAAALSALPPAARDRAAGILFVDHDRSVRMEAAESLLNVDMSSLAGEPRALFRRAIAEYIESAEYRADRGDGLAALANVRLAAGDAEGALGVLSEAISIEPSFTPAYVNKADVLRATGREAEAEAVLSAGLPHVGDKALLLHALGLSQARSKNFKQALANLDAAQRARPELTRYAFVYAVALFDTGDKETALKVLREALSRAPGDEQVLSALADYSAQLGHSAEAHEYAARLSELRSKVPLPTTR